MGFGVSQYRIMLKISCLTLEIKIKRVVKIEKRGNVGSHRESNQDTFLELAVLYH